MATSLFFLLLLLLLSLLSTQRTTSSSSEKDLLLTFKSSIDDPTPLSSWSHDTHLCNWTGITCNFQQQPSPPSVFSLDLHSLNLSGAISPSICKLPSLSHLNLAHNSFNSPLPLHLSQCTSLLYLNLSSNLLWGTLPHQISQLSSLTVLDLSRNQLEGEIPSAFGSLNSLQVLNLGSNLFSGTLHPSLFKNLSELLLLDLSQNPTLASVVPIEIGSLSKLRWLHMQSSGFYGNIPGSFLGLDQLEVLDLSRNNLTGKIPLGFGLKLGRLMSLDLSQNKLSGSFPSDVCHGKALVELRLYENLFTGSVPKAVEQCLRLERFEVQNNGFSGKFASGLWSLPKVRVIRAESNRFSGEIPELVKIPPSLEQVQIDGNDFAGRIPQGLGKIRTMYRFSASLNGFYGSLPANFFDSPVLSIVNLSHNSLSGFIPEFRNCKRLVSLSLADNNFTGNIPISLAHLPVLTYIDLSSNNLSGQIPQALQNLKLAVFNVSFNRLSGSVPKSLVADLPASSLQGNPDLCGPGLPNSCNDEESRISYINKLIIASIAIAFTVVLMLLALGLFVFYRSSQRNSNSNGWKSVFFYPLRITGDELTSALDEMSSIGKGPFGKVYLVQLPDGQFVIVKRLLKSNKSLSFKTLNSEIKTLAKARHKNLAKFLGFCCSGSEVLLIYEYFRKRSLGDALLRSEVTLEWKIRYKIALGTARGLSYLHEDYVMKLLHRNLKANNILLDEDFEPKVSDFGLNRVVGEDLFRSLMASDLSSCCYLAPECRCSKKATEQMDVYSFGVVLLELITGRQANRAVPREELDVVKWVRRKINMTKGSFQVLDPKISKSSQQEMLGALKLALSCTSVLPEKRPMIQEVVRSLEALRSIDESPRVYSGETSMSN